MLESVVADLLNRFLGDYVQDLDRSQLSLGIWGGNVALENLRIRENALSELDVPFKVKYGLIEKLTLKIPWKNLYGDAVVATLEGLYLLVVPGASIKYDTEKEERNLQEAKQRELHRIEEALQKAAQKGKEKEEKKDTFLEKLAAQIIKNLQVKITNIHIRYEDDITDANFPISVGLTLAELSLQTSNERWVPSILHEASKVIYKMVRLDSLSMYWNVSSKMFYRKPPEAIIGMLKSNVVSGTRKPADYQYIFKPISASAKVYINPEAEIEQKTAKFDCNMEVQHVAIELTKPQYLSMIDSLESVDYMVRNVPYRKYRPNVRVEQDCRQWWNYAITSILEVHIKRRTSMWSWRNIAKHRRKLKAYKNTYKVKLTQSKLPEDTVMRLQALESKLDVFNIVLARQQAQAEVVRSGQSVLAKKAAGEKKSGGWFGGFWGGRKDTSSKKEDSEELSVPEKIDDLMTPEEKKKLFTAIGYSESSHNLALHKSYVAHKLGFKLVSTSITIREDANAPETLKIQIIDLSTKVLQRPGAQALRVEAKLDHWYVTGLRQQNIVPSLVSSIASSESSLLKIQYETNPENSSADQVLRLQSQPVEIIYDAGTINALADFFQTHRGMDLEQLTSATLMKLEEIKEKTATGLTHIIQTRKVLDLQINLQPSFLLLPKSGFYQNKTDVIVVDFGNFQLTSINQGSLPVLGTSSLEELMDKAYDKFHVQIKKVQMLFGTSGEDWKKARALNSSSLHILQPLDIDMQLGKSMVERDSRMPRFKVSGELPLLRLKISDRKMQGVFELVSSIPLPQQQALTPATMEKKRAPAPILSSRPQKLLKQDLKKTLFMGDESSDSDEDEFFDAKEVTRRAPKKPSGKGSSPVAETAPEELTDLTLKFEVKEVLLELAKHHDRGDRTVLAFRIQQLGIDACVKTFDLQAASYLKTIRLDYYDVLGVCTEPLHLINSSDNESQDLLKVEYIKAEKIGPRFQTTFENTEQALKVAFSSMELLLHSQALLFAVRFITEAVPSVPDKVPPPSAPKQDDHKETFVKKATKPSADKDVVSLKVLAKLTSFSVNVWDERRHIAEIRILGLDSSVFMKSNEISVSARLQDLCVNDVSPQSLHKQAVCIMEEEVFNFNLMLYLEATQGEAYKDVSKVDGKVSLRVGCMKIVFLHKFIASLLEFLNNFQAAKEKVSAATAQAAQRAATSVKDLAERSFRLLMDVHLKAPVIVIPQSSVSNNAIVADLGLIRIQNQFRLISSDRELAPIMDCMTISLTEFKLSRTVLNSSAGQPDIQILYPVNLSLAVNRNLAATWYHQIPGLEVKGHLNSMDVGLTQEDLNVVFSILMENLSEGEEGCGEQEGSVQSESQTSSEGNLQSAVPSLKHSDESSLEPGAVQSPAALSLLLGFEIKKVMIQLMKQARDSPLHVMQISQLRLETRLGIGGITANVYLQNISLTCDDFKGADGGPLRLINSSNDGTEHLLEIKYVKADPHGPGFKTVHNNIVQRLEASMSSLNLILHTQALLSLVNFLSSAMPSQAAGEAEKTKEVKSKVEQQKSVPTKPDTGHVGSAEEDIVDMKLSAKLNAFNVFVCDETCNIADIRIQGMDASYATQSGKQNLYARLRAIEVINVDPNTIHRKAIYILGDEVFNLQMTLYPDATQGAAYTDMSAVDGKISLKVGCIHIVCLYKFFMSLMNFMNTFQAAKEAVSSATAQAAEKAASSIQDLAQKSFRLAMDVSLKAPVIHVPQSSVSNNVVVADLGFINVRNKFMVVPNTGRPLPPVIDKMDISLTELKLLRTVRQARSPQPELEILQPINLNVSVQRNISSSWYSQIPTIQIDGKLKPMQVALSQADLTVLMNILFENLSETPLLQPSTALKSEEVKAVIQETSAESKPQDEADTLSFGSPESSSDDSSVVTLKFSFHFESLSIMLYNSTLSKASSAWLRHDNQRLGELRFHSLSSSGMMCADGSMDFSICLKTCILDDLREGIARATTRIIDQKDPSGSSSMFDITYKQSREERVISAIIDKLYICASVDFLMTVADFFTRTKPETRPNQDEDKPVQSQSKQSTPVKAKPDKGEQSATQRLKVTAFIMDPEIVFVANLTKGEAPALSVSFQGNLVLTDVSGKRKMTAIVKEFKVLACPFLRELRGKNITTVVQPCSLQLESSADGSGGQDVTLSVDEVIVKISPIILNTVLTIMAFLKAKPKEDVTQDEAVPVPDIWAVRTTDTCNSWFLGVEAADEVTECFLNPECTKEEETFNVSVKSVQVTLECGLGHRTVPLLLVESTFNGNVKNWTSLMNVTADTTLEVHYYNEMFAVWEPLIERVDDGSRRWSLKLEMKNNPAMDKSLLPGDDFIAIPEPQTAISVTSKDTMNITVSKCTLGVFSNLSKAFSEGTASTYDYSFKDKAPLTVLNALGVPLTLQHGPNLRHFGIFTPDNVHKVAPGQSLELEFSGVLPLHCSRLSALHQQDSNLFTLDIEPEGYTQVGHIPITKPSRRLYNVRSPAEENCVSLVVQIDASEGNKVMFVRSPLQIKNHFSVPFTVYKFVANAKLLEAVGVCKPDEEFHVPLHSYRCQLFLKPGGHLDGQFKESTSYIMWKEMLHRSSEVQCTLQCPATELHFLPFIVNCTAVPDEINFICSNGEKEWDPAYIIHLYPSLTIRNLVPYSLKYLLEGTADAHILSEGSSRDVLRSRISGEIMELTLIKYQGRNWNGRFRVHENLPEFFHVTFTVDTVEVLTVDLSVHVKRVGNRMILSVFSPYWIINKTGRILQYKADDIHVKHPSDYRDVILFSFKRKTIFSKNKVHLCISTSSWSSSFSLDTVGSYGCVKCPDGKMEYLVGVNITMSSFNLTRIITLTPFYMLVNNCALELEVGEIKADGSMPDMKWEYIGASECVPFWAENVSGKMCVRVVGSDNVSKPFFFNKQDNGTLLSLQRMNSGLMVDISISDHSIVIRFSEYYEGAAPALIMNHTTRATLAYGQSGTEEKMELHPGEARLFAWEDPTATKTLSWIYSETKGEIDLLKDESGQFAYTKDIQVHWVSFLDGRQRILLFTEDVALVTKARQADEMEQPDQEITVSIHSLGLSLIDNESKQEISYIGITSSGIIWEFLPKLKWKPFSQKQILELEQAYVRHCGGESSRWVKIDSKFEVSFSSMDMRLPLQCKIRRSFLSGIHVEFKQSSHQRSVRAQLCWLQVDNQLPGSMFPAVFHPVAPPKSIALDSEPKPFIDVSIITRFNEFSKVLQFKYFMVLIQCMALKIDQGFLTAMVGLFTPVTPPDAGKQRNKLIQADLDKLSQQLMESSMTDITTLSFFDHFHISPVKLHLSLSLGVGGKESKEEEQEIVAISSINLLLKSIGATLTDVDDVIFKLACFEARYQFYKWDQLKNLVIRHYSEQFLKQLYVLVLGLDVLGNPFGLIRGLSEGVEAFFYEPFQGAVQGPEEFAEGLVIGVRSLLGHTVGGAAGVVSRITGTVGKGLAAMTMDKEYQQKRREEMGRQPKDFGESLAKGGKGLLRGVVGGVTGIVTKPVEGAKKEGAAGFFKGIGKGLVGVVARPTGGIIDMASSTFQGIQRAAESTEEVSPLRSPRFIHEDGIIRPYVLSEAQGLDLFENSNLKKLEDESYRFCCTLDRKVKLVVTNRRVLAVKELEVFGNKVTDWDCYFEDFVSAPTVEENVVTLSIKDKGLLSFHTKEGRKHEFHRKIVLQNNAMAQEVLKVLDEARSTQQQKTLTKRKSHRFIREFSN